MTITIKSLQILSLIKKIEIMIFKINFENTINFTFLTTMHESEKMINFLNEAFYLMDMISVTYTKDDMTLNEII